MFIFLLFVRSERNMLLVVLVDGVLLIEIWFMLICYGE